MCADLAERIDALEGTEKAFRHVAGLVPSRETNKLVERRETGVKEREDGQSSGSLGRAAAVVMVVVRRDVVKASGGQLSPSRVASA